MEGGNNLLEELMGAQQYFGVFRSYTHQDTNAQI